MHDFLLTIRGIELTKQRITAVGNNMASQILDDGDMTPLEAFVKLRAMRDVLDEAISAMMDYALEDADQMLDANGTLLGVGVQVRNGRTVYAYDHDPVWAEMKAEETAVARQRKKREAFLRTLEGEMVDPDTGEFVTPATVKRIQPATLALSFPKE